MLKYIKRPFSRNAAELSEFPAPTFSRKTPGMVCDVAVLQLQRKIKNTLWKQMHELLPLPVRVYVHEQAAPVSKLTGLYMHKCVNVNK